MQTLDFPALLFVKALCSIVSLSNERLERALCLTVSGLNLKSSLCTVSRERVPRLFSPLIQTLVLVFTEKEIGVTEGDLQNYAVIIEFLASQYHRLSTKRVK